MNFGKTKLSKFGDSAVIRLFTVHGDREIGRLPGEITKIVAPLLDLGMIKCNVTTIMGTESRLSIGDSFYINIDFQLTLNAFSRVDSLDSQLPLMRKSKDSGSKWNFAAETNEESILRLRQASLTRLFEQLNVKPDVGQEAEGEKSSQENPISIDSEDDDVDNEIRAIYNSSNNLGGATQEPVAEPSALSLDQLKQFYQANQQSELMDGLPETTAPPIANFKLDLRPYQRKGLSWMLSREKELAVLDELSKQEDNSQSVISTQTRKILNDEGMMNPLWKEYKWPNRIGYTPLQDTGGVVSDDKCGEFFYANMYSGELSIEKPIIKSLIRGGIIADEMGLGKTISTLSLINSVPYDLAERNCAGDKRYASRTTLVVVPMSLLSQWQSEFDKANNNPNHRCIVYYGEQTHNDLQPILCNENDSKIPVVILTTYGTILNEFQKAHSNRDSEGNLPKTGIYSVIFFRIVLDEGHTIRNRSAKTTKAIYELKLQRRWILTGTPVINRLDDLYSLVKFLEVEPWCNFSYWKTFVTLPFEQKKIGQTLDVVKSILEPIFIRRTKNMKQKDGQPLVVLPPKEVVIEEIEFNQKEQKLYDWFKARATRSFKEGLASGLLLKKYSQILLHILRLRQICCHMELVATAHDMDLDEEIAKDEDGDKAFKEAQLELEKDNEGIKAFTEKEVKEFSNSICLTLDFTDSECSICTLSPILFSDMIVTPCGHTFCLGCILEHITFQATHNQKQANCPNCREGISRYKIFKVRKVKEPKRLAGLGFEPVSQETSPKFQLYLYNPDKVSSKIQALINHLRQLNSQHPGEQVVVFSQFSSYLDIIEKELNNQCAQELSVFKFDGRLHMNERKRVLEDFSGKKHSNDEKTTVLLLSLKAGGVGLNLTSASRAFMMDPWWSPSVEDQAIDRIHRIGQVENVKVVRFIMKDSIEQKMLKIQERKKQIGEAVAAEESERAKRRIEEIQMLFEE